MPPQNPAHTIMQQLGGSARLSAMIGAHTFVAHPDGLSFHFTGCRRSNLVRITLEPGNTYGLVLSKNPRGTTAVLLVHQFSGLHAEALVPTFEAKTKLYLYL